MLKTEAEYETGNNNPRDWRCEECGGILGRINWVNLNDRKVAHLCLYACRRDGMATIVEIAGWARVLCTTCDNWNIWYPGNESIKRLTNASLESKI